jgi:sugar phosphate isomerase/epimerase
MKIGLSSYSLSKAIRAGEMTVLDAVQWIADHGGEHVEISPIGFSLDNNPELIRALVRKAGEAGIEISNYCVGANFVQPDEAAFEAEIARVMKQVDIARELGVKTMRHDVASRPIPEATLMQFVAELGKLAEACRRIADYAAQFGITTSVENHGFYMQGSDRVQALVHAVGRENFRTTLDIGNFMCTDEDPVVATRKNLPIACMVHMKDFYLRPAHRNPGEGWFRTAGGNYLRGAIVGHGDIDIRSVIREIKKSGYDGYISIEFEGLEPCTFGSKAGLDNVRRLWDEVKISG